MLDFCDPEVVESLKFHLRDQAVTFRFSEEVSSVEVTDIGTITNLASGKRIPAETVMYSAGRQGMTEARGWRTPAWPRTTAAGSRWTRIPVVVEHIYAVGDVIGFPALARRAWTRAASPPTARSANRPASCAGCSRSASTRSPRSRSAGAPRRS